MALSVQRDFINSIYNAITSALSGIDNGLEVVEFYDAQAHKSTAPARCWVWMPEWGNREPFSPTVGQEATGKIILIASGGSPRLADATARQWTTDIDSALSGLVEPLDVNVTRFERWEFYFSGKWELSKLVRRANAQTTQIDPCVVEATIDFAVRWQFPRAGDDGAHLAWPV